MEVGKSCDKFYYNLSGRGEAVGSVPTRRKAPVYDVYYLYEVKGTSLVKTKYEAKEPTILEKHMTKLRK